MITLALLAWCGALTIVCLLLWYGLRTGKTVKQLEAKIRHEVAKQVSDWQHRE